MATAERRLADAVAYRPAYAVPGRKTAAETGAEASLLWERDHARFVDLEVQGGRAVTCTCHPLGEADIATLLGVQPNTVHQWRKRGLLPEPHGIVSGMPWWPEGVILDWAKDTGRLGRMGLNAKDTGRLGRMG